MNFFLTDDDDDELKLTDQMMQCQTCQSVRPTSADFAVMCSDDVPTQTVPHSMPSYSRSVNITFTAKYAVTQCRTLKALKLQSKQTWQSS